MRSNISYVICLVRSIGAVKVMAAQPSERVLAAAAELAELVGNYEAHEGDPPKLVETFGITLDGVPWGT